MAGVIQGHCFHWGAPQGLSASSGVIGECPGCRRVHPESLGSLGCALGVAGFIEVMPLGSSGSSWVAGFIEV